MTKINATDADYWTLAHNIYKNKYLTPGQEFQTKKSIKNPDQDIIDNHNWITVTSINDKNSDLQAAMVVPADEYEAVVKHHQQPSQAIFVARGTSSARDWETNISELATGHTPQTIEKNYQNAKKENPEIRSRLEEIQSANNNPNNKLNQSTKNFINQGTNDALKIIPNNPKEPANQFIQYDKFVDDNLKKYKPKEYSFTGHSLGGGLTMRQGVRHNAKAVAFAGANSYRTLTAQQKKDVKAGKYNDKIINYRHYGDLVPNVPFDIKDGEQTIGKQQFVTSAHPNLSPLSVATTPLAGDFPIGTLAWGAIVLTTELGQHLSSAWGPEIFNSNGSVQKISSKFESFMPTNFADFETGLAQMYSGKGGNGGEKIKISPDEINALACRLTAIVASEITTTVKQINTNAEKTFESNYESGKQLAYQVAPDLSYDEIMECLRQGGVTHKNTVTEPTDAIKAETKKMTQGGQELEEIANKTHNASSQFTDTDNQIGGQFS